MDSSRLLIYSLAIFFHNIDQCSDDKRHTGKEEGKSRDVHGDGESRTTKSDAVAVAAVEWLEGSHADQLGKHADGTLAN